MKVVGCRSLVALLLALLALPEAHAARVLGGGPAKSDCYSVFDVLGVAAAKGKRGAECHDGDAACDSDGVVDKSCHFTVSLCVLETGVVGCTLPTSITKIPKSGFSGLTFPATVAACGSPKSIKVRAGKRKAVRLVAHATATPKVDRDTLTLICLPGVASPDGAFLDRE